MKLDGKKDFAARVLGVGKGRIAFNNLRLADIKEALTRQDIIDLCGDGAIIIKEIRGRAKKEKRKTRKRAGSFRHKSKKGKDEYMIITRKSRAYIQELREHESITEEQYQKLRKEIRARMFKDKVHLKERIAQFKEK